MSRLLVATRSQNFSQRFYFGVSGHKTGAQNSKINFEPTLGNFQTIRFKRNFGYNTK